MKQNRLIAAHEREHYQRMLLAAVFRSRYDIKLGYRYNVRGGNFDNFITR